MADYSESKKSNNVKFYQTRNEIIKAALSKCRVGAVGEEVVAEEQEMCIRELNAIMKFWQTQGFHIWKLPEAVLFLRKGKDTYELGSDDCYCTNDLKETHLVCEAIKGQNSIYVAKKDEMKVGDYMGITLCCGGIFLSKIADITDELVTLEDILPNNACRCCKVYYYHSNINKPLKIVQARREVRGSIIPMNNLEQEQFFKLVNYSENGTPLNYNYMPKIDTGTLKIWHAPDDNATIMRFIYEQQFEIFDNSKETPDIPFEWVEPLTWELAYRLSANFGLGLEEREWIKAQAKETLEDAKRFDQEWGSFYIYPAEYRGAF